MLYFNRFDISAAYYCFAALYHEGQFSDTYKILGRLDRVRFKPGLDGARPESLEDNARAIFDNFDNLVRRSGNPPYDGEEY